MIMVLLVCNDTMKQQQLKESNRRRQMKPLKQMTPLNVQQRGVRQVRRAACLPKRMLCLGAVTALCCVSWMRARACQMRLSGTLVCGAGATFPKSNSQLPIEWHKKAPPPFFCGLFFSLCGVESAQKAPKGFAAIRGAILWVSPGGTHFSDNLPTRVPHRLLRTSPRRVCSTLSMK